MQLVELASLLGSSAPFSRIVNGTGAKEAGTPVSAAGGFGFAILFCTTKTNDVGETELTHKKTSHTKQDDPNFYINAFIMWFSTDNIFDKI